MFLVDFALLKTLAKAQYYYFDEPLHDVRNIVLVLLPKRRRARLTIHRWRKWTLSLQLRRRLPVIGR